MADPRVAAVEFILDPANYEFVCQLMETVHERRILAAQAEAYSKVQERLSALPSRAEDLIQRVEAKLQAERNVEPSEQVDV